MDQSSSLRRLTGTVGLLVLGQFLFIGWIMAEQRLWLVCPSATIENRVARYFTRTAISDDLQTVLLLLSTAIVAYVLLREDAPRRRKFGLVAAAIPLLLFWMLLAKVVHEPRVASYLFDGPYPLYYTGEHYWPDGDITEIQRRIRADPMFHLLFWAGIGQASLITIAWRPQLRDRRITLRDIAIFVALICIALGLWTAVRIVPGGV